MSLSLGAGAAISGVAGAAGSLASTGIQYLANKSLQEDAQAFNAQEAATARQFAHDEAQLARDFEASKYQRTVQDMKAAGINPASVGLTPPSGGAPMASSAAAASSGAGSVSSPALGNIITSAFNSAMIESMRDERFMKSLVERTAYHANVMDNQSKKLELAKIGAQANIQRLRNQNRR